MANKNRKQELKQRLNFNHLVNNTSIFKNTIGEPVLHDGTVNQIKNNLKLWFDTYITPEANELL